MSYINEVCEDQLNFLEHLAPPQPIADHDLARQYYFYQCVLDLFQYIEQSYPNKDTIIDTLLSAEQSMIKDHPFTDYKNEWKQVLMLVQQHLGSTIIRLNIHNGEKVVTTINGAESFYYTIDSVLRIPDTPKSEIIGDIINVHLLWRKDTLRTNLIIKGITNTPKINLPPVTRTRKIVPLYTSLEALRNRRVGGKSPNPSERNSESKNWRVIDLENGSSRTTSENIHSNPSTPPRSWHNDNDESKNSRDGRNELAHLQMPINDIQQLCEYLQNEQPHNMNLHEFGTDLTPTSRNKLMAASPRSFVAIASNLASKVKNVITPTQRVLTPKEKNEAINNAKQATAILTEFVKSINKINSEIDSTEVNLLQNIKLFDLQCKERNLAMRANENCDESTECIFDTLAIIRDHKIALKQHYVTRVRLEQTFNTFVSNNPCKQLKT